MFEQNDFGEIAYIVCTVAAPPTHDPSAFVSTTESTLARLRKTERQFRENSILAALDVEARQLFTFYKKVDITAPKDQKTLLLKFGYVLRSNVCTIAYKTAARLPDLMKPEQARLYRLFITAIVSSIKLLPTGDTALQPVGPNLYLVERTSSATELDLSAKASNWSLYRIDLQVVLSGHIILTIARDDRLSFSPIYDCLRDWNGGGCAKSDLTAVYLAPIGRIARLTRSKIRSQININGNFGEQRNEESLISDARREMWKELLPLWLREHMNIAIQVPDVSWIEVEVPVEEIDHVSNDSQQGLVNSDSVFGGSITWRTIFWPASLCFLLNNKQATQQNVVEGNQDPMQFVRDWILGTGNAASKAETRRQSAVEEEDDEPLFADEGTFDDPEHFQPFGPPAFPASQTIYPTPPDVGMTQPTPGLSSLDGLATTPANLPGSQADLAQHQDEDMPDFEDVPPASGLPGYYDEDLFEEMPDDNFGQEANGDEPNWDFFDRPRGEAKFSRSASHSRNEGSASRGDPKQERVEANDANILQGRHFDRLLDVRKENLPVHGAPNKTVAAQLEDSSQPSRFEPVEEKGTFQIPPKRAPPLWQSDPGGNAAPTANTRRRSSVYNGLGTLPSVSEHDSRYEAEGDYWFDASQVLPKSNVHSKSISIFQRPPSSSSGSDSSMTSTSQSPDPNSLRNAAPTFFRQWTQYNPDSPGVTSYQKEVDKKTIQQDVQQMLGLLKPSLVDPPALSDFQLDEPKHRKTPPTTSRKMQHIAQVLVDQISQTSLIAHGERQGEIQILRDDQMEVNVDLSGINTSANPSNVFQLINLKADHNSIRLQGRVIRLRPNQICVRRLERSLTASISILNFWDTLNLQPENGSKDVTAFCIHPHTENVREGSLNLLQRLADSYNTCALGTHTIGRLPGLTENGLISWSPDVLGEHDLLQSTTMVGNALAVAPNVKGTVVVYMVSRSESPTSYLEMCIAFYNLFESFTQARIDNQGVTDIALQVIPWEFVANAESLVIPPQTAYIKLAVEIYNRLPPLDLTGPPAACGSAVILSRSENTVHLQLTPTYGSPTEKNGPCLHLAYSLSLDQEWLTAVWTDELGRIAHSMSYCSRVREAGNSRPRHDIFREMWEVSQDLMSKVRGPWRLAVVRHGYYEPQELLDWQRIFDGSSASQKRCLLMLLSVQIHPGLSVFPPPSQGKGAQTGSQNQYGTPASTPQASMTSPDQIVPATPTPGGSSFINASTPPDLGFDPNAESDLTLVDVSEESWGIILPYGTNQSRNMTELRPSQVTGFLMRRKGTKSEDGYNLIEASLVKSTIHTSNKSNETSPDELLEDVIRQYRGLVTLGATRGCVDPNRECIPWHLATAIRGALILEQVM